MTYQWYVLHAISGSENKIKSVIFERAAKAGISDAVSDIIIPSVTTQEVKRGKTVNMEKKYMPGYILIKADMTDKIWGVIKDIPKVTGFLGNNGVPQSVSEKEIKTLIDQVESNSALHDSEIRYEIGEKIKITSGPFESFTGKIEEVEQSKAKVKVSVLIFGRSTPIDLEFMQIEKCQ